MAFLDRVKAVFGASTALAPVAANVPGAALAAPAPVASSFVTRVGGDLTSGSDGGKPSLVWGRYTVPMTYGYAGAATSLRGERNRRFAASVTEDLSDRNPTLSTIINESISSAVGTGLTLSSKPKADRLRITEAEANSLAHAIEQGFAEWCANPLECDFTGRHDFTSMVTAMYRAYGIHGEAVGVMEWERAPFGRYHTKLRVLDPRQIDVTKTCEDAQTKTLSGVAFDASGRWVGVWVVPYALGTQHVRGQSVFVPAVTPHGRTKIVHTFSLQEANQVRGKTPFVGALTPVKARETAAEFVLDNFLIQNQYPVTITSDLPANAALSKLEGEMHAGDIGALNTTNPNATTINPASQEWHVDRAKYYKTVKIGFDPGVVTPLMPGDKLEMKRAENPHGQYLNLDKSLARQAARASGEAYEVITGDFADTSYSASRLSMIPPHRTAMRRRREIVQRICQLAFECWLEEALERGLIDNPSPVPFYQDKSAYACAKWRGVGPIVGDRYKEVKADELELRLGLNTIEGALADRGLDFEDVLDQIAYERRAFEERGLPYPLSAAASGNDSLVYEEPSGRRAAQ